ADGINRLKASIRSAEPVAPVLTAISKLQSARGALDEALTTAQEAMAASPGDLPALEQVASISAGLGSADRLHVVVDELRRVAPDQAVTHYSEAASRFLHGRLPEALSSAQTAVNANPNFAEAHGLVANIQLRLHQMDAARQAFLVAVRLNPRSSEFYVG